MFAGFVSYIPQVHIGLCFWRNILKNENVMKSIFFTEELLIARATGGCRTREEAQMTIATHKNFYKRLL